MRVSDKIWGYVISCRGRDQNDAAAANFKHFLVDAGTTGYCLFGSHDFVHESLNDVVEYHSVSKLTLVRVRTDPGKVWKVLEFNVEIFKALKSLENDHRCGKVWKNI